MSTEKVINRWFVAVGNSVIQLVFGAIYALLIFTKVLSDPFTKGLSDPVDSNQFTVTALQTARIFSSALFFVALVMIFSSLRW